MVALSLRMEAWKKAWLLLSIFIWLPVWKGFPLAHGFIFLTDEQQLHLANDIAILKGIPYDDLKAISDKRTKVIVGGKPKNGLVSGDGIFFDFSQAYHFNFAAVQFWREARLLRARTNRDIMIRAWDSGSDIDIYEDLIKVLTNNCELLYNHWKTHAPDVLAGLPNGYDDRLDPYLKDCINHHEFIQHVGSTVTNQVYTSAREALELMLDSLYYSVNPLEYNAFPKRFHWSLFENMMYETTTFDLEIHDQLYKDRFQNYIDKVRAGGNTDEADRLVKRLEEIKERLNNPAYPYHKLYFKGDQTLSKNFWDGSVNGLSNFRRDVNDLVTNGQHFADGVPYKNKDGVKRWKKIEFSTDISEYNQFFGKVKNVYEKYLYVKMLPQNQRKALQTDNDGRKIVIRDGLWDWDLSNGIQNMRLAWELMGGLLEEIKCYMKDTYYFDLRDQALQATQLNLVEGALFSGISQTLYFPCRIENETDLVSPYCTANNHEICAPMAPLERYQRTDSDSALFGAKSLLKPKWVYRYKDEAKMCWGRKDYVMQHYACQCGFRLDCGKDLGGNLTCQLRYNDLLRGQCRGSVGYPCKTLPLAPGKHHESCASGYCDIDENSCEDRPHILQTNGGDSILVVKSISGLLVCLGGLIIVVSWQWMMMTVKLELHVHSDPPSTRSGGRPFNNRKGGLYLGTVALFLVLQFGIASGLRDDWYGFVSFDNASEFESAYHHTCSYTFDLFREPREYEKRDNLRARRELLTPIRFSSKETKNSTEKYSLHIYNYPAIRKGYSVSYGFQRDKECLQGQDAECVVYPETGRARALFVNAERFTDKKHNLNFIKDHFLIESPEHFVSILNGGSSVERKFYEAVFLGGYSNDPSRSSHQIDGKKYPLEIYMYFLDETVPSVSLATILVVLVAESSRDNHQIKPILNAVESKLYDSERRFLHTNKLTVRQERLFHHLMESTNYEVYRPMETDKEDESIIHQPMESSVESESSFSKIEEAVEKMQAVDAELFFLLEDHGQGVNAKRIVQDIYYDFQLSNTRGRAAFPNSLIEYKLLLIVGGWKGILEANCDTVPESRRGGCRSRPKTCWNSSLFYIRDQEYFNTYRLDKSKIDDKTNPWPEGDHQKELIELSAAVCQHFHDKYEQLSTKNHFDSRAMKELTVQEKYEMIWGFAKERFDRREMNKLVYKHFHGDGSTKNPNGDPTSIWHDWINYKTRDVYQDVEQKDHIVDSIFTFIQKIQSFFKYEEIVEEQEANIGRIATRLGFADSDSLQQAIRNLQQAIRNLKHGSKFNDLRYDRSRAHKVFEERKLPLQEKKRTLAELKGMEILEEDILRYEALDPIKATVDEAFQISWLIPQYGGYYYYQGSSPVPPCFRAQNVIVFKRPITMSKRQIEILTRIPTSFNRSKDILFTTPLVHDTFFEVELSGQDTEKSRIEEVIVPVYNHRKNHLFLGHDGVRKNAAEEWERIVKLRNAADRITQGEILAIIATLMSIVHAITLL